MLTEEIQIHRKPPVKASDEQIYLDKEDNWKVMCLIGNRILSVIEGYYVTNWLSLDMKKYMWRLLVDRVHSLQ